MLKRLLEIITLNELIKKRQDGCMDLIAGHGW